MRRIILGSAICLLATVLLAAGNVTPLNVKTGLWETTSTNAISGVPGGAPALPPGLAAQLTPEQRAQYEAAMKTMGKGTPKSTTYKSCLTRKQLTEDPFKDQNHPNGMNCENTVVRSTGSDLEIKESCTGEGTKADVHLTFHASSSEHVTGTGTIVATTGGRTMNSNIKLDSKWLGATCPAGMK